MIDLTDRRLEAYTGDSYEFRRSLPIRYSTAHRRTTEPRNRGGDIVEICCGKNGVVRLLVADVSSKGLRSSEHERLLRTAFLLATLDAQSPAQTLRRLNAIALKSPEDAPTFASAFVGMILPGSELIYASAGHDPVLMLRGRRHEHLPPTGPVLNIFPDALYSQCHVPFDIVDRLAISTDGVVECFASGRTFRQFGTHGIAKALCTDAESMTQPHAESVLRATDAFCAGHYRDDATIVVIDRVPFF
jgi:phosphoserine phosphatase RsbU/P